MNTIAVVLLTIGGLLAGAALAWLALRGASSAVGQRKSELEQEVAGARSQLAMAQQENSSLRVAKAAAEATLESERKSAKEKLEMLNQASEEMRAQFKALAATALESNNTNFLQLAKSELEKQQSQAKSELEKREKAMETLVKPIADSLKSVDENVRALETSRAEAYGGLKSQVASLAETEKALHAETGNLVKALREPQARGRWGELQLRRALEFAGMLQYCDFEEQVSTLATDAAGERHMLRPDVIVRLPGGKQIVIDAKVPITEYLKALEAPDDKTRETHLGGHARQVKEHVTALAAKGYWAEFAPTPEFVILFIPGEAFFRAAFMADPGLLEFGGTKVMLASPITLVAMLRTVAYAWNEQNLADNARKIGEAGRELYTRLCKVAAHVQSLGKKLDEAVKSYNEMLSSIETRVFPAGRRIADLDRSSAIATLPEPEQVERISRQLGAADWQLHGEIDPLLLESEDANPGES